MITSISRRLIATVMLVICAAPLLVTQPALASVYYIHRTDFYGGSCDSSGYTFYGTFSWSVPKGNNSVHDVVQVNGTVVYDSIWTSGLPTGIGTYSPATIFSGPDGFPTPTPYSVYEIQDWKDETGMIFAHTEMKVLCWKPSAIPQVTEYDTP